MEGIDLRKVKVLELFSGIGGMHFALNVAQIEAEIVAAIDISEVANKGIQYFRSMLDICYSSAPCHR